MSVGMRFCQQPITSGSGLAHARIPDQTRDKCRSLLDTEPDPPWGSRALRCSTQELTCHSSSRRASQRVQAPPPQLVLLGPQKCNGASRTDRGQLAPRGRLTYSDAEYFNQSDKDSRIAGAHRVRPVPTLEQIRHVLGTMPSQTAIQKRDRALIASISSPARGMAPLPR